MSTQKATQQQLAIGQWWIESDPTNDRGEGPFEIRALVDSTCAVVRWREFEDEEWEYEARPLKHLDEMLRNGLLVHLPGYPESDPAR